MDTHKNEWMFLSLSGARALAFFSEIKGRIDESASLGGNWNNVQWEEYF